MSALELSTATLAHNAKARLKKEIELEQEATVCLSMASEFHCLGVMASSSSPVDRASEVLVGEVRRDEQK